MNYQFVLRRALPLAMIAALFSCQPKSSGSAQGNVADANAPQEGKPAAPVETIPEIIIPIEEVSAEGCLQLAKLRDRLNTLNLPTAMITIDHRARSEMTENLRKYFAFAAFEYRVVQSGSALPFLSFTQEGCKNIRTTTTSGEPLNFTITKHTESTLTLERAKLSKDLPAHLAKALEKRAHPVKYRFSYEASARTLTVETEFSAIDPLCGQEKLHDLATTRKITWAHRVDLLPETHAISPDYLKLFKETTIDGIVPGLEEDVARVSVLAPAAPLPELLKCK